MRELLSTPPIQALSNLWWHKRNKSEGSLLVAFVGGCTSIYAINN